jgi:hypothetical protein
LPAVIGFAPSITHGGCWLELQIEFVTAVHTELSGDVSNWTVTEVKPVVLKVTRHETHGRLLLEFACPVCVPVPVKL